MRRFRITYSTLILILAIGVGVSIPMSAHAFSLSGMLIGIAGWILWAAASLFDAVINNFVLQMGALITGGNTNGIAIGESIDKTWSIVRDLVNLTFIFGLVYVGLRTILNVGTDTKKLLASILIGALLVNFSLFISKIVIDVSNITATEIYQQMGIGEYARTDELKSLSTSEVFMARMGLVNLVSVSSQSAKLVTKYKGNIADTDNFIMFVIGANIFILVAAFVFAAGAILLAIRFGFLIILMILSPLAFAAAVFPGISGWSTWWWKSLFTQAFFAPAYLFMLYITLFIADGYQSQMGNFDGIFMNVDGVFQQGFTTAAFFVITIVMMVASLLIAKNMGAVGASRAVALGGFLANSARRGTQGIAGRYIIGKPMNALDQSLERRGLSSTNPLRRLTSTGAAAKFGSSQSYKDVRTARKAASQVSARNAQVTGIRSAITAGSTTGGRAPTPDQTVAMERSITGASSEQLLEILGGKKPGDAQYDAIVENMSASQFDALMKTKPEDLDDAAKATLASARTTAVRKTIETNARKVANAATPGSGDAFTPEQALAAGIKEASAAQLKLLGATTIAQPDNVIALKQSQIDDILKDGSPFTESEKSAIHTARENALITKFNANPAGFFSGMRNDDIAKLPKQILLTPASIAQMKPGMLAALQNKLGDTDRDSIRNQINVGHPAYSWLQSPRGAEF